MDTPVHVLFLCTHNSARSILAEALLNHMGQGNFKGFSAGSHSQPHQQPHPLALQTLQNAGIATLGLRSKNWGHFAQADAPHMDLIITVCNQAANEPCPAWPGRPTTAHWGYPDPGEGDAPEAQKLAAFNSVFLQLTQRIMGLVQMNKDQIRTAIFSTSAAALLA